MQEECRSRRATTITAAGKLVGRAEAYGARTPHVYPTPTSLVSPFSALGKESIPYSPPNTTKCLKSVENEVEATEGWGIPLIMGRIERKLEYATQVKKRRPRRKLPIPTRTNASWVNESMEKVRKEQARSSFLGSHFPNDSLRATGESKPVSIPIGDDIFVKSQPNGSKSLIHRLVSCKEGTRACCFSDCAVAVAVRDELRCSLSSLFLPICKKYNASLDTACLAYALLARVTRGISPRLATTRSQMYIATLMIAFKFNEEEDPVVADFAKTILKSQHCPEMFTIPTTASVVKMEQRVMKAISWRIQDIVNPMILSFALLDGLHPGLELDFTGKRKLSIMAELFLAAMLHNPGSLLAMEKGFDVVQWTVFALGSVFHLHCREREPRYFVRQLYRQLYPRQWPDARQSPPWYEKLASINVRNSIIAEKLGRAS